MEMILTTFIVGNRRAKPSTSSESPLSRFRAPRTLTLAVE